MEQGYLLGTGICSLTLEAANYSEPKVNAAEDSKYSHEPDLLLSVLCRNVFDCIFSATMSVKSEHSIVSSIKVVHL